VLLEKEIGCFAEAAAGTKAGNVANKYITSPKNKTHNLKRLRNPHR
jgi:hypothetical protein